MPAIATLESIDSGHSPYAPTMAATGDPLFTVNGISVLETGSIFMPHIAPNSPTHAPIVVGGTLMTINGKEVAVVGDVLSCGATIATGNPLFTID